MQRNHLTEKVGFIKKFEDYIVQNCHDNYEEIILDKVKIQNTMIKYLETLRVVKKGTNERVRPKSDVPIAVIAEH